MRRPTPLETKKWKRDPAARRRVSRSPRSRKRKWVQEHGRGGEGSLCGEPGLCSYPFFPWAREVKGRALNGPVGNVSLRGWLSAAQSLLDRLSATQKIVVVVVAVAATVGMAFVAIRGRQPEYTRLELESAAARSTLTAKLDENGIAWRPVPNAETRPAIEVRAGEVAKARRWIEAASSSEESDDALWSESPSWLGFGPRPGELVLQAKLRRLRNTICWNPRIAEASVEHEDSDDRAFVRGESSGSASVVLKLSPGVERLTVREAQAVRTIVSSAFGFRPDKVHVVDHKMHRYDLDDAETAAAEARSEALRAEVEELLQERFDDAEFRVSVSTVLRDTEARVEAGAAPRASGGLLGAPQLIALARPAPAVARTRVAAPRPSSASAEAARTRFVRIRVDRSAALRVARGRGELAGSVDTALRRFEAGEAARIRDRLIDRSSLHLSVTVFDFGSVARPTPSRAVSEPATAPPAVASNPPPEEERISLVELLNRERRWLGRASVALGVAVVVGLGYWLIRRRRSGSARSDRDERGLPPARPKRIEERAGDRATPDAIASIDTMSGWVTERPQSAANVLRAWLGSDSGREAGGER